MVGFFDKSQSLSFKEVCSISLADIMNQNNSGFEDVSLIYKYLDEKHHHTQVSLFFFFLSYNFIKIVHGVAAVLFRDSILKILIGKELYMSKLTLKIL